MSARIFSITLGIQISPWKLLSLCKLPVPLTMPKSREYIPRLQKQRMKNREKTCDAERAGISYLQFLGSGANGAPRSLYFFTDKKRYMFNAGEGIQRIAHEHKVKISRMEHIFVTYPIWENMGGLPGLALTLQECGVPDITIHGPKGLSYIFEATRRFVILNNLNVQSVICEKNKTYQDGCVIIEYVPLVSNNVIRFLDSHSTTDLINDIESMNDDIDYYAYLRTGQNSNSNTSTVSDIAKICMDSLPVSAPVAVAYICSLTPKAGSLSFEKCVDKGVPAGPLLGKLKNGEDITLPNGAIVKSADVKSPDEDGPSFIVVDCPTIDFIESLSNEKSFERFQKAKLEQNTRLLYIIHFTPGEIMEDERYRAWMKTFPESTLHVNANDKNKCLGCVGVHEMQYKLNQLDPQVFPLLKDDSIPILNFKTHSWDPDQILENAKIDKAKSDEGRFPLRNSFDLPDDCGNTLRLLPLRPADYENKSIPNCVYLTPADYIDKIMHIEGFPEELQTLKKNLESLDPIIKRIAEQQPYPRITFLGTGSSIPNKTRNTSGILVCLSEENHILMDCGEGTYGQIVRHFGFKRAEEVLANLNIIFISHLHADHHIGLITILKQRRKAAKLLNAKLQKVILLAPKTILFWLIRYQQQFEEIFDCVEFISNQDLEYKNKVDEVGKKFLQVSPLQDLVTSYVTHCPQAFGISFTHENGCKVTYSGDTMPSKGLIDIGKNSDLLIHEATFEDSLELEAKQKYHSTTSQAIDVGEKMDAKFTLLTHFSQRYCKLPLITEKFTENVGIAFDNMVVSMSDLPKLHLFNPTLQLIFEEQIESIKTKNLKRKRLESY